MVVINTVPCTHDNTRRHGFRAKITPDSNEDAVTELRREIK